MANKYDTYLALLSSKVEEAGKFIPKMCDALKDEGLTKEDINDKVTKDCLAAGLASSTIIHNMPDEYKNKERRETGKKASEIKKKQEILVTANGSVASETEANHAQNSSKNDNQKNTQNSKKKDIDESDYLGTDKEYEESAAKFTNKEETEKIKQVERELQKLNQDYNVAVQVIKEQNTELENLKEALNKTSFQSAKESINEFFHEKISISMLISELKRYQNSGWKMVQVRVKSIS